MSAVFVDLDGTLLTRTSSRIELLALFSEIGITKTIKKLLTARPRSRAGIKVRLTELQPNVDYSEYFNKSIVKILADLTKEGRAIIVATGAMDITTKRAIENYPIPIFDLISSSIHHRNKGVKKLSAIEQWLLKNNVEGFYYMGDAYIDLKIMKKAKQSFLVGSRIKYFVGKNLFNISNLILVDED